MITKDGRAKDGETINRDEIKDGNIIKVIDKIEMASLAKMGITRMAITRIITIKIMEIDKEGIWSVSVVEKDIKGMIVHYGNNI